MINPVYSRRSAPRPLRSDDPQGQRIEMNAASGRGIPSAASVHATGADRNSSSWAPNGVNASPLARRRAKKCRALHFNPLKNHLNPKYVSAINMIAAPAAHHIGNSFASSLRSNCSARRGCHDRSYFSAVRPWSVLHRNDGHSLTAPTVVATNSVARDSRANAGRRGFFSSQQ